MSNGEVLDRMRADWNERAREDARYYVAFGRRNQDEAEFFETAGEVLRSLRRELRRLPADGRPLAALEIGCGLGRLMRPLGAFFSAIHGVDVSDEMVRRARDDLRDIPHAHVRVNDGHSLAEFAGESFDFVYSYAVFQHIPSRDVVFDYLREAWRVLRTGGYLRCQINALPAKPKGFDTWSGVRISGPEIAEFARDNAFQLLALEGESTQYMWATLRKRPAGWQPRRAGENTQLGRISNAYSPDPAVPVRGRFAAVSLWLEGLPEDCDLNHLAIRVGGLLARPFFIGPLEVTGLRQVNVLLPEGLGSGLMPVDVLWLGNALVPRFWLRVIREAPAVPQLVSVSDAAELSSNRILSGAIKLVLDEVAAPDELRAFVDGRQVEEMQISCADPLPPRYEVNLVLPPSTAAGRHELRLDLGSRRLAAISIEVIGTP